MRFCVFAGNIFGWGGPALACVKDVKDALAASRQVGGHIRRGAGRWLIKLSARRRRNLRQEMVRLGGHPRPDDRFYLVGAG